jgi:competence protein ComEC
MGRLRLVPFAAMFVAGIASELASVAVPAAALAIGLASAYRAAARTLRAALVAAFVLGACDAHLFGHFAERPGDTHLMHFPATVLESTSAGGDRTEETVRLPDGTQALAGLSGPPEPIGERLVLRGQRVTFDGPRNPGEPAQRELEAERGISWRLVHARVLAATAPDEHDASLWIARARDWASRRLHALLGEPEATILAGAMWGERGTLPPDVRDEFQETGTVHVLVTAGLHLGVVAATAVAFLRMLGCGRVSGSLATIAVVWTYAAFSGAHLPSLRAATMLSFGLLARAAGREALSWNALSAAAIVVAAVRPASVPTVSFELSFSCVAAIIAFAKPFARGLEEFGAPHVVAEVLALSLATQLGTWPLTASAFLVIAPYAPLANAAVVPVVGIALLAGFATIALSFVPVLGALGATLETSLIDWMLAAVRFTAGLPGAHVVATPPPPWTIAVYDGAVALAAVAVQRGRPRAALALVLAACALCLWPPRAADHELHITAIDVGQADALLIQTPGGHAFLVDAGGRLERGPQSAGDSAAEDIGARIVVPFLLRAGVHHLDAVLLSHPHGDHAGGLAPVLRTLGANGFADSGQTYPGHAYHDALDAARAARVPMLEPRGGDVWHTSDGVTFRFYGPSLPYITGSHNDINSNSLVVRLEYGRFRMLFMGDAGTETEQRLLAGGDDLRADVLKVGHHGSAYGTTLSFVRAVAPRAAVISVGRHNLFGHPAPATIRTLLDNGITVYRTDRDGAVTIESDGHGFVARRFLSPSSASTP